MRLALPPAAAAVILAILILWSNKMMKALLAVCMIFFTASVLAGESPIPSGVATGEVLEVKNVANYTYLRLKSADGEIWAAVGKSAVKKGSTVTLEHVITMHNFESKSLKKTFPVILFGNLQNAEAASHADKQSVEVHVARATGENSKTVEDIVTHAVELKDKSVVVRGKIVKYNAGIMGKNWIHLRDGTGLEGSNDLLVTTTNAAKSGDVVTVTGIVRNDKDFGAGYSYKVLIEDATLQGAALK